VVFGPIKRLPQFKRIYLRLGVLLEKLAQLLEISVASASTFLKKLTGVIAQLKRVLR
jgi:hypothetical protein